MNLILRQRLDELQLDTSKLCIFRDLLRGQIHKNEVDETKLRYYADLYQKCAEVIKTWLEDSLQSNVDSISELATGGLHNIIHDQELYFKIKQEQKYNRVAMRFVIGENGIEGDPVDSFGGGSVLVVSLILRLAIMARMNMGNLLLLDESLFALANQYVPACATFMRRLSEQTGINILMVTHNEEFMSNAHMAYEGEKKGENNAGEFYLHHRFVR